MFSRLPLNESFQYVASPDDWQRFQAYGPVTPTDLWVAGLGSSYGPLSGYDALSSKLATAAREKLFAGEWLAEGFDPERGPRLHQIDRYLWALLDLNVMENAAVGGGFKFVGLLISDQTPATVDQASKASARSTLLRWLETLAHSTREPMTREAVFEAARRQFGDRQISRNMFNEAWGAADLPPEFRHRGRPPKALSEQSSGAGVDVARRHPGQEPAE
jgi:hypothetical protein